MEKSGEPRPLEYYLKLKYPVTIHEAPEGGYVAEIEDLPGCLSQGETVEEALQLIGEARCLWIESAHEDEKEIPSPRGEKDFSGKFVVRVPKSLHRMLDKQAEKEGVSLNQYLVATLSRSLGYREALSRQEKDINSTKKLARTTAKSPAR
jgi:antitoxin HicB